MRVKVLRVSKMPHNTDIWVDRGARRCTYYVDQRLISAEGAALLEAAANINLATWLLPHRRGATG